LQEQIDEADKWDLVFPDTTHASTRLSGKVTLKAWIAKGYPVNVYNTVSVSYLWNLIMESTYNRNEPGVLFLDRANHFLPLNYAERILSTNPCGEQTLAPGGVCCLGTLNLTQFVLPEGLVLTLPPLLSILAIWSGS
jgi:ribonucleoside-diphosphate reductase alpha chain